MSLILRDGIFTFLLSYCLGLVQAAAERAVILRDGMPGQTVRNVCWRHNL